MTLEDKNQKDILNSELIDSYYIDYVFDDKPINRFKTKPKVEDKSKLLVNLRGEIENIENCELKDSATKLVFSDGNYQSKIMIVGEGPGQKEDEIGKPFVGDAGTLLNKMLKAINIERSKVYITNVVNYRPPNNRKPEPAEINRYSNFLRNHISIIALLRPGIIKLQKNDGNFENFFVQDGTVEYFNDNLVVLSASVMNLKDLSKEFMDNLNKDTHDKLENKNITDHERYVLSHKLDVLKDIRV